MEMVDSVALFVVAALTGRQNYCIIERKEFWDAPELPWKLDEKLKKIEVAAKKDRGLWFSRIRKLSTCYCLKKIQI